MMIRLALLLDMREEEEEIKETHQVSVWETG